MATIAIQITEAPGDGFVVSWAAMANGDAGDKLRGYGAPDRCVQVEGVFDGATVVLEGSNDGALWHTLRDPTGAVLSFTAAGLKGVLEVPRYVRPSVSGGGASTAVNASLFIRGQR